MNKPLSEELFTLHRRAYPAPWCWEQCGDKCDDPVIGAAWWDDDEDCAPIVGQVIPPDDNANRELYREAIALEMPSHADGSASANAELIVWLRNHVTDILEALRAQESGASLEVIGSYGLERTLLLTDPEINNIIQTRLESGAWFIGREGFLQMKGTAE